MTKTEQKNLNDAFHTILSAINTAADAACASRSPHQVWSLINQQHSLERARRRLERELEHIQPAY